MTDFDRDPLEVLGRGSSRPHGAGIKYDAGKPRWSLLPWNAVTAILEVIEYGAKRYGTWNWTRLENARDRYFDALVRHLLAWRGGETFDSESKLRHLAHAGCNIVFLLALELRGEMSSQGFNENGASNASR